MTLKRTVTLDASTPRGSLTKRLKRVEQKQRLYAPSKLTRYVIQNNAGALANGALRYVQISAATGKIFRVQIRGFLGGQGVDAYLVQTPDQVPPTYAMFTPTVGGCLADGQGPGEAGLVLWKHYLSLNGGSNFSITQRFKYGFETTSDNNLVAFGKALWLVYKNDGGSSINPQSSIETWTNYANIA